MPADEPSFSASSQARKEDLEPMVQAWTAGEGGSAAPTEADRLDQLRSLRKALNIRIAITVVLALMAVIVMIRTRHGLAYFFASSTPTALGDVRDRFVRGDKVLGAEDDTYVSIAGLVPTRLLGVAPEDAAAGGALAFVFYCPLFDITVLSRQRVELPAGGWSEFDPRLKDLVLQGVLEPAETMVSWRGEGRLMRGSSAPAELKPFVGAYARRMGKSPADTWVLVEGQAPSHYTPTFILWLVAFIPTLLSIYFLVRARRTWEQAVETGPRR